MQELDAAWERLASHGETGQGYVRLRLPSIRTCAAYAARRIADNVEALLTDLRTIHVPADLVYPTCAGVVLHAEPLEPGPQGRTRIILRLEDTRFRDVFRALVADLATSLVRTTSEQQVPGALVNRLTRWQDFLRRHGPGGLGLEARRGLFGELTCLEHHVAAHTDGLTAVRAWRGWDAAHHDFECALGDVETKTTHSATPHSFRVHSVRQLDVQPARELFVALVVLDESERAGISLPEVVSHLRDQFQDVARSLFDDCLTQAGYLDGHASLYDSPRYSVRGIRYFQVHDQFPRLLGHQIPDGVEDIEYSVSLAGCSPYECDEATALDAVLGSTR